MSAVMQTPPMPPVLPWTRNHEEEQRFHRILLRIGAVLLLLSLVMPFLPVAKLIAPPEEEPTKRYVRLLLEPKPIPQTAAPPEETRAETAKAPEVAQVPVPKQQPASAPSPKPKSAREQAQSSGILAMRQSLGAMRNDSSAGKLKSGELSTTGGTAERTERSVLTSKVAQGSGGIDSSSLSRNTGGGVELGGRSTRVVSSPIGDTGPAGGGAGQRNKKASRTDEEIQLVFDRNKGTIFGVYNRALRENAGLQGRVVLRLTIAPSGAVTNIGVVSSELSDAELERKLLARIKAFSFGEKDVDTVTVTYPIHFFPS